MNQVAKNASDLSERTALRELFSIRHDHGFPTINGYRLARAPDDKRRLHWNEINAAWGEVRFLTLSRFSTPVYEMFTPRLISRNPIYPLFEGVS